MKKRSIIPLFEFDNNTDTWSIIKSLNSEGLLYEWVPEIVKLFCEDSLDVSAKNPEQSTCKKWEAGVFMPERLCSIRDCVSEFSNKEWKTSGLNALLEFHRKYPYTSQIPIVATGVTIEIDGEIYFPVIRDHKLSCIDERIEIGPGKHNATSLLFVSRNIHFMDYLKPYF